MHSCALLAKALESSTHIVGECEMYTEERDVLKEMKKIDECDKFDTLDSREKTIAILGDRWPQTAKQQKGVRQAKVSM